MKAIEEYVAVARARRVSRRRRGARRAARARVEGRGLPRRRASTSRGCAQRARAARAGRGSRRRGPPGRPAARSRAIAPSSGRSRRRASSSRRRARERSTGPGRHDFEIVVDPYAGVEDDLARRDFTVNAMARRLADGTLVDPFGGRDDLERRAAAHRLAAELRRGSAAARARRSGSSRSSASIPSRRRCAQMRERGGVGRARLGGADRRRPGGRRDGGAVEAAPRRRAAQGAAPRPGHRRARGAAAGVRARDRVRAAQPAPRPDRRRAHLRRRPGHGRRRAAAARPAGGAAPRPGQAADRLARRRRLPALLREARPATAATPRWAPSSRTRCCGGCATRTTCASGWCGSSASTCSTWGGPTRCGRARLLARFGDGLLLDLLDHKEADLRGKGRDEPHDPAQLERLRAFRAVVERELTSPHRLSDLAVDGTDLIGLGYLPGPELGRALSSAARPRSSTIRR